jgi:hypothetical protein
MVEQWLAETESSGKSPFGSGTSRWRRTLCAIPILRSSFRVARKLDAAKEFRLLPLSFGPPPPVEIKVHTHPRRQQYGPS